MTHFAGPGTVNVTVCLHVAHSVKTDCTNGSSYLGAGRSEQLAALTVRGLLSQQQLL